MAARKPATRKTKKIGPRRKTAASRRVLSRAKIISVRKKTASKRTKPGVASRRTGGVIARPGALAKSDKNPIISPRRDLAWESLQTFNPAAVYENGKVHLLYRALGEDGRSVVGYASSVDGIEIDERLGYPVFISEDAHYLGPGVYSPYISGGGWGGCEDPRITRIDDRVHMTYVAFDGWSPPRIALTSISLDDFLNKKWKWAGVQIISRPGIVDKSGCLFPEKINGKYAILHRVFPNILLDFVDSLDFKHGEYLKGEFAIKPRAGQWDSRKIGAGAPPIKTPRGWLLLYYGVDERDASQYKIGAMLLDLQNPARVIARSAHPVLEPVEWYENQGHKAGIAYPCGAAVIGKKLFVYYGGADTVVCVATADLESFVNALMTHQYPTLTKITRKSRG